MSSKLPSQIEIEINTNCNRSCEYCPNSISKRVETGDMDPELFKKIIDELSEHNYTGKLSYMFYNEPLLSKNYYQFSEYAREKLPLATFVLYSNGSKINNLETFNRINRSIDQFIITKHHQEKKYPFEDVYLDLSPEQKAKVNFRRYDEIDLFNRGGILPIKDNIHFNNRLPCHVPSYVMTISVEGNVISCFEDYHQELTFGNLKEHSLSEVWNSDQYTHFRNDLTKGHRHKYSNCSKCNRTDLPDTQKVIKPNKHFLDEKEVTVLTELLTSKKLYRYQKEKSHCETFENNFSEKFGFHGSVLINSGTNALIAALMALEIGPGDEVIIPSYTYIATAAAILNRGAIPVIANIDETLTINVKESENLITEKTKAIIAVHMDGLPCSMDDLVSLKEKYSLKLIEDTAQAIGGKYKGQYLGSFGDIGCYSLNVDKNITTGEGGIVATKCPILYERLLCCTDHGYSFNQLHHDKFHHITPFLGHSMRVSEITGALANVQLGKLDMIMNCYRERKEIFLHELEEIMIPRGHDQNGECHHALHFSLDNPKLAAFISKKMMAYSFECLPVSMRPAHAVWKWGDFLGTRASYSEKTNPLKNVSTKKYHKINFLSSYQILNSTLKLDIDPTLSLEQTRLMAIKIKGILKEFIYRYNNLQHRV